MLLKIANKLHFLQLFLCHLSVQGDSEQRHVQDNLQQFFRLTVVIFHSSYVTPAAKYAPKEPCPASGPKPVTRTLYKCLRVVAVSC